MAANLAGFARRAIDGAGLRHAAVAILVSPYRRKATFVLTRRALTMRRNAGNYALPGGNCEPGEDAVDTALRETAEELGVSGLHRDAALGRLDDFVTLGGHRVTPVVLWSDQALTLAPDPVEVHAAWRIPLAELDHPGSPRRLAHAGSNDPILQMRLRGSWINAPTAAWVWQFREVALHGRATRLDGVGQPEWTRG
ncbi:CoA pyrophosphatase [Phenylobacterium sp.]|uniref:NUDIX hydrolase n=1 Tax=Phenylobacterium sp. TaxID=1871053 RepID=UPI0025E40535|nr:CoA pyrophosphatase [Phenylobacterium sp.]